MHNSKAQFSVAFCFRRRHQNEFFPFVNNCTETIQCYESHIISCIFVDTVYFNWWLLNLQKENYINNWVNTAVIKFKSNFINFLFSLLTLDKKIIYTTRSLWRCPLFGTRLVFRHMPAHERNVIKPGSKNRNRNKKKIKNWRKRYLEKNGTSFINDLHPSGKAWFRSEMV